MHVSNTGGSTALGVTPSNLVKLGTGNFAHYSGPAPASAPIAAGASAWFTWTYSASSAGNLAVNSNVSGNAQYSNALVTSSPSSSTFITIQSPASLSAALYAPSYANISQAITVIMVITNTGNAAANGVTPTALIQTGTGGAVYASGATPGWANIAGNGGTAVYTWVYSAGGTGTLVFSGQASGTDFNSGFTAATGSVTSNLLTIQSAANLAVSLSAHPALVGTGYAITVYASVTNTGEAAANSVRVLELDDAQVSGGNATLSAGLVPTAAAPLAGGSSAYFTWIYNADTAGTINFTATASGTDANTGDHKRGRDRVGHNADPVCRVNGPGRNGTHARDKFRRRQRGGSDRGKCSCGRDNGRAL
jgi:hypothetical protein